MEDTNTFEDEEISLIDLLAVLIRFRKFIAIFTVAVAFLATFVLFVLPRLNAKANTNEVTISYSVKVRQMPQSLIDEGLPKDISNIAKTYFVNPRIIARQNKKFGAFGDDLDELTDRQYNTFVQNLIKQRSIEVPKADIAVPNEFSVIMNVKEENTEKCILFFNGMLSEINASLDAFYRPQLESIREATDSAIAQLQKSAESEDATLSQGGGATNLIALRQQVNLILSSDYVVAPETPFIESKSQGRAKKLIIAVFAAFFCSVFCAFAYNAWKNIQTDPKASKTLKEAWDAGK